MTSDVSKAPQAPKCPDDEPTASWQRRFMYFERIEAFKMGLSQALTRARREKLLSFAQIFSLQFNLWGLLFGPVYYLCKRMWSKGLWLFSLAILLTLVLEILQNATDEQMPEWLTMVISFVVPVICCTFANYDYYLLRCRKLSSWSFMPEVWGRPMVALVVLVVLIAVWVLCVFRMPEVVESAAVDYVAGLLAGFA